MVNTQVIIESTEYSVQVSVYMAKILLANRFLPNIIILQLNNLILMGVKGESNLFIQTHITHNLSLLSP